MFSGKGRQAGMNKERSESNNIKITFSTKETFTWAMDFMIASYKCSPKLLCGCFVLFNCNSSPTDFQFVFFLLKFHYYFTFAAYHKQQNKNIVYIEISDLCILRLIFAIINFSSKCL